jgi:hypothetical protein
MSKTYWLSSPETSDLFERLVLEMTRTQLAKYKLVPFEIEKDGYGSRVKVRNSTTGVQFNYEPGSLRIWTLIYKLKDGTFPIYQLTPIPGETADYYYLEDLMIAADPTVQRLSVYSTSGSIGIDTPITEEYLRTKLETIGQCLIQYASDILEGNFVLFAVAQKLVDERIKQATT